MPNNDGLDIAKITTEAQEYVNGLTDKDVLRLLTSKRDKEAKKKLKAAEKKALKKAIDELIEKRGGEVYTDEAK